MFSVDMKLQSVHQNTCELDIVSYVSCIGQPTSTRCLCCIYYKFKCVW